MVCEGVNVDPKTYNGSLAGCTVNKVRLDSALVSLARVVWERWSIVGVGAKLCGRVGARWIVSVGPSPS
jgi:hypothetical protein